MRGVAYSGDNEQSQCRHFDFTKTFKENVEGHHRKQFHKWPK